MQAQHYKSLFLIRNKYFVFRKEKAKQKEKGLRLRGGGSCLNNHYVFISHNCLNLTISEGKYQGFVEVLKNKPQTLTCSYNVCSPISKDRRLE